MKKSFASAGAPRKVCLAGLTWIERYNCYSVVVSPLLNMGFSYMTGTYVVKINGNSVGEATDTREAALLAVRKARELTEKTLEALSAP